MRDASRFWLRAGQLPDARKYSVWRVTPLYGAPVRRWPVRATARDGSSGDLSYHLQRTSSKQNYCSYILSIFHWVTHPVPYSLIHLNAYTRVVWIVRVKCIITYLGVNVNDHCSWSTHIDFMCNKLRVLLSKFYHLSLKVPTSSLKRLYMAFVDSILSYGLDN